MQKCQYIKLKCLQFWSNSDAATNMLQAVGLIASTKRGGLTVFLSTTIADSSCKLGTDAPFFSLGHEAMHFLFGCSTRLTNNVAGSLLFHSSRLSTRRVLSFRRSTPRAPLRRAFASTLPPLAEDDALLSVGGSGHIILKYVIGHSWFMDGTKCCLLRNTVYSGRQRTMYSQLQTRLSICHRGQSSHTRQLN